MATASETPPGGETPPVTPAEQPPTKVDPPAKAEGNIEYDDFGYPKVPNPNAPKKEGEAPGAGDPPKETPVTKISEVKEPGTGYGEEAIKVEEVVVPPVVPVAPAVLDELDKVLVGLPKVDADEIKAFATENKIAPEVAAKWADKVKANIAAGVAHAANMEKQAEQQKNIQRKKWHDELKADPTFGGEKFQANVVKAEKVLAEFMPETKKFLTERKSMLPPYVMRDLAKMSAHLYETDKLNTGEPLVAEDEKKPQTMDDRINDFYGL